MTTKPTLPRSLEACQVLFEGMMVGCAICRIVCADGLPVDWFYLAVNPAYLKLTGLQDVTGRRISEVLPSLLATSPEVLTIFGEVALNHATKHFEMALKPLGIWVNVHAFSPEPEIFIVTLENITAIKEAEAALRLKEQHYRMVTENVGDEIWTIDLQGRFTYVSPSVERLRGFTQAEAMAQGLDEILGPEDLALAQATLSEAAAAAAAGRPIPEFCTEWEEYRKDGSKVWTEVRANELRDENGGVIGFLGVSRDITDRMASEAKFRLAQEERDRLIQELTQALGEVRQLSGLLPICAHCKKIRDDQGYWNQIEAYIASQTTAQFTHGICPDCLEEHFPAAVRHRPE